MSLLLRSVRRFYVDNLFFLDTIIQVIDESRILLGSHWPFHMGAPNADQDLGHLDAALRRLIRKTNAEEAFGSRLQSANRQDMS